MMTERETWLKAMAIVEEHGTLEAGAAMGTLMDILDDESECSEWAELIRVAAAVDAIAEAPAQYQISPRQTSITCGLSVSGRSI